MKMPSLVPIVILLAAASSLAQAQIYKWVDESGKTHYSDQAPADGKKVDVPDRVSVYTPDARAAQADPAAAATAALSDKVDTLERQLQAERMARQQIELASYSPAQASPDAYVPYPVPVAVPVRHRHHDVFRPSPGPKIVGVTAGNVVGQGIMPGTFNGPNAITAGNFTVR